LTYSGMTCSPFSLLGAFDIKKNKVSCTVFDFKTVLKTEQIGCQGTEQKSKLYSCPPLTTGQFFVLHTICLKYKNNLLSTKHRINTKFVQHFKFCPMLYCSILFYNVLSSTYIFLPHVVINSFYYPIS
jgi:hypothetical protein